MKKIDVFLLAAGESSRMFPLSTIMEKSLLPVNGKPVIRHIIENLTVPEVAKHIRRIIICCLTKFKKQFEHEFRDMPSIEFKEFPQPVGTFKTFNSAIQNTKPNSDYSMVHYADCLTEIDYVDFITTSLQYINTGVIAITNTVKHDYSDVECQYYGDGIPSVLHFREKPEVENYSWSGIGIFDTERIVTYHGGQDFGHDILPEMVMANTLKAYQYRGSWYDVGNLNSYRKVCALYDGEK